uniref:Genome polyprotein n=1 Tax=Wenling bighead beaked sandfish picornavirus TaxID=2116191 RepID=A0A2P1GNP5_9VIRU|nr:polyprotein [Wenling bighead beaked sandfish picornavirus]
MESLDALTTAFSATLLDTATDAIGGLLKDDTAPVEAPNVVISDQSAVAESQIYDVNDTPPALSASTVAQEVGQMNIQRFLRLDAASWSTSTVAEKLIKEWKLPDIFNSTKYPTYNLMKNYHWMRSDYEFNLIVNANMGFSGALVLVYRPQGSYFDFKTFRNFPNVMINCSLNTSARLKIPYVNWTQYCGITGDTDNNGVLALYVLGQLRVPPSGGQEANWTLYGKLLSPEFQAFNILETPSNGAVRVEEAAGSMFLASRHHTALRPRMGLTSEKSVSDSAVVGDSAFRSLKEVTNVESLWQAVDWTYTDAIGKRLTISNIRLEPSKDAGGIAVNTNLGFLSSFYYGYKGDLTVTVQTISSRLNQGKLLIVFFPGEDNANADITIDKANNGFTQVLDLGGKTTVRFTLPYVCQQTYRPVTGIFGRFAVFVLNPLTYTPACVSTVRVLFYIGGSESFSFVYPRHGRSKFEGDDDVTEIEPPVTNLEDESSTAHRAKRPVFRNVRVKIPDQIKADHMMLSNLFGRAHALKPHTATTTDTTYKLVQTEKSFLSVFKLFRYRSGDMTLHIVHTSDGPVFAAHSYLADDLGADAEDNYSEILSQGAVCMLPKTAASICVPFYVLTPFVATTELGKLLVSSHNDATYNLRASVTFDSNTRFYFLQSPPAVKSTAPPGLYLDDEDFCSIELLTPARALARAMERRSGLNFPEFQITTVGNRRQYLCWLDGVVYKSFCPDHLRSKIIRKMTRNARDLLVCGDVESNPGPIMMMGLNGILTMRRSDGGGVWTLTHSRRGVEWAVSPSSVFIPVCYFTNQFMAGMVQSLPLSEDLAIDASMGSHSHEQRVALNLMVATSGPRRWLCTLVIVPVVGIASISTILLSFISRALLLLAGDVERNPGPCSFYFVDGMVRVSAGGFCFGFEKFSTALDTLNFVVVPTPTTGEFVLTSANIRKLFLIGNEQMRAGPLFVDNATLFSSRFLESVVPMLYALQTCAIDDAELPFENVIQWILGIENEALENAKLAGKVLSDANIRRMLSDIGGGAAAVLVKGFLRVLLYCLILSADTSAMTILSVTGLVAIDSIGALWTAFQTANIQGLVDFLLPGECPQLCAERRRLIAILTKEGHDEMQAEGLTDITFVMKNLEWWMTKLVKISEYVQKMYNPDQAEMAGGILKMRHDEIVTTIASVSDLLQSTRNAGKVTNQDRDTHDDLREKLVDFHKLSLLVPRHPMQLPLSQALSTLRRLNYGHRIPSEPIRPDPIGIHFYGEPGAGKTVLMVRITKLIAKALDTEVFVHAPGSEFLDGYSGQEVHYIDEFMAHTDEKESNLILQLMGCAHSIVPLAGVEDKGMYYKGKVVITTANTPCMSNSKLKFPKAVLRRFTQVNFRAKNFYQKKQNGESVFNIAQAIKDGTFKDGSCWEYSLDNGVCWKTFDFKEFVQYVLAKVKNNQRICDDFMQTLKDDEVLLAEGGGDDSEEKPDTEEAQALIDKMTTNEPQGLFTPLQRVMTASKKSKELVSDWLRRNSEGWTLESAMGVVLMISQIVTIARVVWSVYSFLRDIRRTNAEAPYDKATKINPKKVMVKRIQQVKKVLTQEQESPVDQAHEFQHILDAMLTVTFEKEQVMPIQGMAYHDYTLLTYAHGIGSGRLTIQHGNMNVELEEDQYEIMIMSTEDGDTDLCWIVMDKRIGFQFKNMTKIVASPVYGYDCLLLKKIGHNYEIRQMTNVSEQDHHVLQDRDRVIGMRFGNFKYFGKHAAGDCGSLIIQKIKGCWKVIGMHNSGAASGPRCAATRLDYVPVEAISEGIVVSREQSPYHTFQPGRTNLKKSPFHGAFDVLKEPAVLSKKDRRLTVDIDNLVKDNAGKYRVDRYDANETIMAFAVQRVKDRLHPYISPGRRITIEQAITGLGCNPIDKNTSPGLKYTNLGLKKEDLYKVDEHGDVWVSDRLRADVEKWIKNIDSGVCLETVFNTVCKDELRSLEKIALGKTRVIEAAELDYVIAYRMIMTTIYSDIYEAAAEDIGLAVGINPPQDGHSLYLELNKYSTFLALDYSRFDGSLPKRLMEKAVDVLASFHVEEEVAKLIHQTVITSKHQVVDEFWCVQGGMPSGSPCTTVLNCLCNLIVLEYAFLEVFGLEELSMKDHERVNSDYLTVVYGDDCVIAYNGPDIGLGLKQCIGDSFGMEVTPATKTGDEFCVDLDEVEFLKRTFFKLSTAKYDRYAMRLSLTTIEQSLMWMRSERTFDDQIFSLAVELSAWGKSEYARIFTACKAVMDEGQKVNIPFYDAAWETYLGIVDWPVHGTIVPRDLFDPVLEISDTDSEVEFLYRETI